MMQLLENLTEKCRVINPVLITLILIPIALHLWSQMLGFDDSDFLNWDLFSIANDVPYNYN